MAVRLRTMVRAVVMLVVWIVALPGSTHAFFCRYPHTHLSGVADVGGSKFVRLDLDLRFNGAECEVQISGQGRCRPVARRTLGITFTIKGACPSETLVIDNASYVRRGEERVADVTLEIAFKNGQRCRITGTSPALYFNSRAFGGPLPSLSGSIVCPTTIGSPGVAEFVRR